MSSSKYATKGKERATASKADATTSVSYGDVEPGESSREYNVRRGEGKLGRRELRQYAVNREVERGRSRTQHGLFAPTTFSATEGEHGAMGYLDGSENSSSHSRDRRQAVRRRGENLQGDVSKTLMRTQQREQVRDIQRSRNASRKNKKKKNNRKNENGCLLF